MGGFFLLILFMKHLLQHGMDKGHGVPMSNRGVPVQKSLRFMKYFSEDEIFHLLYCFTD